MTPENYYSNLTIGQQNVQASLLVDLLYSS